MNNDNKIMELKKQIREKREKLASIKKFSPITNCILDLDGTKSNIQVLSKDKLTLLACKLLSYKNSSLELGYELKIGGFLIDDWISDIKSKLDLLTINDEKKKLQAMEDKLTALLSNEKRTELKIEEIANLLNGK